MVRLATGDPSGKEGPGPAPDPGGCRLTAARNTRRSMTFLVLFLGLALLLSPRATLAFDEVETSTSGTTQFRPYAPGFTGEIGEDVPRANPVVWGGQFTAESDPEKQIEYLRGVPEYYMNCSSQVGPDAFGYYYCTGKAYGQCDRRTGTCYCNLGYQGENCTDCSLDYHKVGLVCEQKKRCPNDCSGHGTCNYSTGGGSLPVSFVEHMKEGMLLIMNAYFPHRSMHLRLPVQDKRLLSLPL